MKYGEKLIARRRWSFLYPTLQKHGFRYRIDPVPFIKSYKGNFKNWYKIPKTTQERRWSFAYGKYVRVKRNARNLPNAWDDYSRSDCDTRRSWKNKKIKKQWMKNAGVTQLVEC